MSRPLLLVDIGNSRIKWALASVGVLTSGGTFVRGDDPSAGLDRHWSEMAPPGAVHVANVAGPAVAERLADWVRARWGLSARFARAEASRGGVINGYDRPEELGVDRWLGLLGLHRHYPLPACLVDCGTAVTLDLLDADGRHRGGLIAPGLAAMRRSLRRDTHALGPVEGHPAPDASLGRDTLSGMATGCVLACAGLVEKCVADIRRESGAPIGLVLSGGDAATVGRRLSIPCLVDETIVLRGLLLMAESE